MTPQQIYQRALNRLRMRIATMERNLNGASLSVHEEFEELCLIVVLLEHATQDHAQHEPLVPHMIELPLLGDNRSRHRNGQHPTRFHPIYVIIDSEAHDSVPSNIAMNDLPTHIDQYGGQVLVDRSTCEVIEGNWYPKRVIVQRWPSADAFHHWYSAWKPSSTLPIANIVLVEAIENEVMKAE